MEKDFANFIQFGTVYLSLLVAVLFTYHNWQKGWFGKLFSIVLFLVSYGIVISTLAATGMMVRFPHTFRTGLMVLYLVPALTFFGLRVGFAKIPFRLPDLFHLLPFIFYLVNFFPSIFASSAVKRNLITPENMRGFQEGIVFASHAILWLTEFLILFYMAKIYKDFILKPYPFIKPYHQITARLMILFLGIQLMPPLFAILGYYDGMHRVSFLMLYSISSIGFYLILLNRPKIMYGTIRQISLDRELKKNTPFINAEGLNPRISHDFEPNTPRDKEINGASPMLQSKNQPKKTNNWKKIEKYLEESMAFLNTSFTQEDLMQATGLSAPQIRRALQSTRMVSFPSYINEKRINHLLKMLEEDEKWRNYNMASLANGSGFKSLNSFYLSFKKITGVTPKEYIDKAYFRST